MEKRYVAVGIALVFCMLVLAGCGGGGEEAVNEGGMQISVTFPPLPADVNPAVIYEPTNSITVDIIDPATAEPVVPRTVVNRPDPQGGEVTVMIEDIPAGTWMVKIAGWENENGGGKMLSRAHDSVTISVGTTATKSIVMEGWPYELILAANQNPILVDSTTALYVTPRDVDGNTLLGDFMYNFSSSDSAVCTVAPVIVPSNAEVTPAAEETKDAVLEGMSRGVATITAELVQEGSQTSAVQTAQAPVTGTLDMIVHPNVDEVVVTPSSCQMKIDESITLTAEAKYKGNTVPDIDFSFSSADSTIVSVTKTGENTAEMTGISGGTSGVEAAQPYTRASAKCEVTVPYGNMNVIISETD